MKIGDIEIEIVRKRIKNMYLRIKPPQGNVEVTVPVKTSEKAISEFVSSKTDWILKKQKEFQSRQPSETWSFEQDETHYFLGRPYKLRITHTEETPGIEFSEGIMDVHVSPRLAKTGLSSFVLTHYRRELLRITGELVEQWRIRMNETHLPVSVDVKMMRRQWGKCFPGKRAVEFNLMLARLPRECIVYVVVHELAHLKIANHQPEFHRLMTRFLPDWKLRKKLLNRFPGLAFNS